MLYLFDSTRNKIEKCQNIKEKIKLVEKLGDICVKLYERFGFKRLLIGALSRYLEQLELAKNVKNYELSEIHSSIAVTQTDLEDIDSAIEHYRFAISEAKTPKKQLRLVYEFHADIIEKKKHFRFFNRFKFVKTQNKSKTSIKIYKRFDGTNV